MPTVRIGPAETRATTTTTGIVNDATGIAGARRMRRAAAREAAGIERTSETRIENGIVIGAVIGIVTGGVRPVSARKGMTGDESETVMTALGTGTAIETGDGEMDHAAGWHGFLWPRPSRVYRNVIFLTYNHRYWLGRT